MECYIIPPNNYLELMHLGDRYFCLAQIYNHNPEYREFFKQMRAQGKWVTLDNGAGDHALITEDILFNCMEDLMPNEVIPPDTLFDKDTTLSALDSFIKRMDSAGLLGKIEIFACPQGKDFTDWLSCYNQMLHNPHVNTIGMSKIAVPYAYDGSTGDKNIKEGRNAIYTFLKVSGLIQKPLHFLGMGDPTEFEEYKGDPLCRSTDSCNTVWSAMNEIHFKEGNYTRIKTPHDYFERTIPAEVFTHIKNNVAALRMQL